MVTALAGLMTLGSLAACGAGGNEDSANTVYIANYYGGLGDEWLYKAIDGFKAANPDVTMNFKIDNSKTEYKNLPATMATARQDVYVVESVPYIELVSKDMIADVTDVVTEKLTKYGEEVSILDKLGEGQAKEYFNIEDKYYAMPTYLAQAGFIYDVDLFEENELYMKEGGGWTATENRTVGQDGEANTQDDGLPVTYDDFFALLKRMRDYSLIPLTWMGLDQSYSNTFLYNMVADYEGYDNMLVQSTLSGTLNIDGVDTPIDNSNGYLLQKVKGKEYALQFARELLSNNANYLGSVGDVTYTHRSAQLDFLASRTDEKRIAMLLDGDWWETEARSDFDDLVVENDETWAYGTRRFAMMPIPKANDGSSASGRTALNSGSSTMIFINANTTKMEVAKRFFQYLHTEEALRIFTQYTGVTRPYDYDLTPEQRAELTYFQQSRFDFYQDNDTKIYYSISLNDMMDQNNTYYKSMVWSSDVNGTSYSYPFTAFLLHKDMTAKQYFDGLYDYHYTRWSRFDAQGWW